MFRCRGKIVLFQRVVFQIEQLRFVDEWVIDQFPLVGADHALAVHLVDLSVHHGFAGGDAVVDKALRI